MSTPASADTVLLHSAGSLRGALTEVSKAFEASGGGTVQSQYVLKDEIASGAKAEVFASANMDHPQALASAKRRADRWCCSRATGCARWCGRGLRSIPRDCSTACSIRR